MMDDETCADVCVSVGRYLDAKLSCNHEAAEVLLRLVTSRGSDIPITGLAPEPAQLVEIRFADPIGAGRVKPAACLHPTERHQGAKFPCRVRAVHICP